MTTDRRNKSIMHSQKFDTNDDGAITLAELSPRQNVPLAKLDSDENGIIKKHEFNARLNTMFHRIDRDGNGLLRDDELTRHPYQGKKHQHVQKASDPIKNSTCAEGRQRRLKLPLLEKYFFTHSSL